MKLVIWSFLFILITRGSAFADPLRPGGDLTHNDLSRNAFNHAGPNVGAEIAGEFGVGNALFKRNWVLAGSATKGLDGLGPTYNARSCSACHSMDGRGKAYEDIPNLQKTHLSLLFRISQLSTDGKVKNHPHYGDQINSFGNPGVPAEAQTFVQLEKVEGHFPDGSTYELRRPLFSFTEFNFGAFDSNTLISPRVAPQMVGLGLLEAISEADILKQEDPFDRNQDQISGRANWVFDIQKQKLTLGRFGWKANQPNLRQQNAAAFLGDIGLTSFLFPEPNCPLIQVDCVNSFSDAEIELGENFLDRMTVYTQAFGVPVRRDGTTSAVIAGEKAFKNIGCAHCHTPSYMTSSTHELAPLRNQKIYPYSDFLLHDMGSELADGRPDGLADGREWRTPPLWGIGLLHKVSGHQNLLHDGRARGVEEAILWHGGEAQDAREKYKKLILKERVNLVKFVNSL